MLCNDTIKIFKPIFWRDILQFFLQAYVLLYI